MSSLANSSETSTGWGGSVVIRAGLLADYFGRSKFAAIYGLLAGISMIGNMAGASIAGWIFDTWGTYEPAWIALSFLSLITTNLVMTIASLQKHRRRG